MVTLPRDLVDQEGIEANQIVTIVVKKARTSGFGMCKGIGPLTKKDKFRGQLE